MQFMILNYEDGATFASRTNPAKAPGYWGAWTGYVAAMREAGIMLSGNGLQPPETGTTVRLRQGKRQVTDGPIADTKEQLGGYFVVEVPNLDIALEWAARCPAAEYGAVEVRPVLPPMNQSA